MKSNHIDGAIKSLTRVKEALNGSNRTAVDRAIKTLENSRKHIVRLNEEMDFLLQDNIKIITKG